jgi:TusA-related sulfurtransferase
MREQQENARDYSNAPQTNNAGAECDLRGIRCPLNWVKAKLRLEELERGQQLVLWLDDPKGARDLPRAAEAEGHVVVSAEFVAQVQGWRIVIEK